MSPTIRLTGIVLVALALVTGSRGTTQADACGAAESPCVLDSGTYHALLPDGDRNGAAVVLLHGGGGTGKGLLGGGMAIAALARGYVFVAPNGYHPTARFPNNWAVRARNFGHEIDDIAFLGDVMDDMATRFAVDRTRILLSGFSRGGSMVWDVACFSPGLARAYAASAGAFWDDLPDACAGPVELFHTHGWADRTVPLEGRPLFNDTVAQGDVWESLRILRAANGCHNRQPDRSSANGERWWRHWTDCAAGRIDLMLHSGGHGIPGGWAETTLDWFEERLAEDASD